MTLDPVTIKNLAVALFSAGAIWGGVKAGNRSLQNRMGRLERRAAMLMQYKAWSHRALSVLMAYHKIHHPGELGIEDWREAEEGVNGGSNGNA